MIVVIDNYDSFTYNLVQYLGELVLAQQVYNTPVSATPEVRVYRNDAISVKELAALHPSHIIISPGPGEPDEAGISRQVILELGSHYPILGVCLGHQCIGEVYGGQVVRAGRLMHGKTSRVYHYGEDLFTGIPSPFEANRYHSLIVAEPVPPDLQVTAFTNQGEVMGLKHRRYPVYGVQFHPESILTQYGKEILKNFLLVSQPPGQPVDLASPQNDTERK